MNLILYLILAWYFHFHSVTGVCFDDVGEYHQSGGPPLAPVHHDWHESVSTWYVPFQNKVEMYETARLAFGKEKFHALDHKYLETKSCPSYKMQGSKESWTYFGNRSVEYFGHVDPIRPEIVYYTTAKDGNGVQEYISTSFITKTDNATYQVVSSYWADGRKGFLVISPEKKLNTQTLLGIGSHVKELGFKSEFFVENNYDLC